MSLDDPVNATSGQASVYRLPGDATPSERGLSLDPGQPLPDADKLGQSPSPSITDKAEKVTGRYSSKVKQQEVARANPNNVSEKVDIVCGTKFGRGCCIFFGGIGVAVGGLSTLILTAIIKGVPIVLGLVGGLSGGVGGLFLGCLVGRPIEGMKQGAKIGFHFNRGLAGAILSFPVLHSGFAHGLSSAITEGSLYLLQRGGLSDENKTKITEIVTLGKEHFEGFVVIEKDRIKSELFDNYAREFSEAFSTLNSDLDIGLTEFGENIVDFFAPIFLSPTELKKRNKPPAQA